MVSILDPNSNADQRNPAKDSARKLIQITQTIFLQNMTAFNGGSQLFWNNPEATPQEIADELGTNAGEVFELHAKLGQLLQSIKEDSISEGMSFVGNFTINEDGTVTVIVPEVTNPPELGTSTTPLP